MYIKFDDYLHFNLDRCDWYELSEAKEKDGTWELVMMYPSGPKILTFDSEFEGKNWISKIVTNVNKMEERRRRALSSLKD